MCNGELALVAGDAAGVVCQRKQRLLVEGVTVTSLCPVRDRHLKVTADLLTEELVPGAWALGARMR